MKRILHWLAHRTRWNRGEVVTWWHGALPKQTLMVGFRCLGCGKIQHAAPAIHSLQWPAPPEAP